MPGHWGCGNTSPPYRYVDVAVQFQLSDDGRSEGALRCIELSTADDRWPMVEAIRIAASGAHFRDAPKLVLFFVCVSPSLSSASFVFFLFAFFMPVADVGVAVADPAPSRNDAEIGVGA